MDRLKVGDEFLGWGPIDAICNSAKRPRDELLILTTFKTGGRISNEVLTLTKENFDFEMSENSILVKDMLLDKKFKVIEKVKEVNGRMQFITQKIEATRDLFPILRKEPLSERWINLLEELSKPKRLLFTSWNYRLPLHRQQAWNIIKEAGKKAGYNIGPHYLRGQRASQLEDEYDFTDRYLNRFFGWSEDKSKESRRYPKPSWRKLERLMLRGLQRLKDDVKLGQ